MKLAENNENIVFTGFVTGELKLELIAHCRLFVLPSDTEGMPVAIVEAVGFGRPCLVRNILSFQYLFENEKTAFFCEDEKSLYDVMKRVIRMDRKEIMQIGMTAREELSKKYSYLSTVDTFEMVYKGL